MKRLGVIQSSYIPWKGYFAIIGLVDEFIIYDDVQYTKQDWRNRNRIKQDNGTKWLTIPVSLRHHGTIIRDVEVTDQGWAERHWAAIRTSYRRARHFSSVAPHLCSLYESASTEKCLSQINEKLLRGITRLLGFDTSISRSSDYELEDDRNERLISFCRQTDSQVYLSGQSARAYIDERRFSAADISIGWMTYLGFPRYRQLFMPPFIHEVTILDLLLNEGLEGARVYMRNYIEFCEQTIFSALDSGRQTRRAR